MAAQKGKGGGSKKYGRNKKGCEAYRMQGRRKANKILKVRRQAKRSGGRDRQAINWLKANDPKGENWVRSNL